MTENVHVVTDLPKARRISKKFVLTVAASAAVAVAAVAAKKNISRSGGTEETVTDATSAA